ncbi:MAG TPA: cation diffusion facilitator family transporter [Methanotrichaceae archaeon]|nr:cation diffusion facilitator family transporter [Methanotrichaceae archaeon]
MAREAYYLAVRRVLILVFFLNIAVALSKLLYGLITGSLSMTSDGLHSIFDSASNIIGLVGIAIASRPPDKEHPYGHAKFETFASIGIAVLLFATCLQILEAAVGRLFNSMSPEVTSLSFIIMGSTLAINIGVSVYERSIGRRLGSDILVADSIHTQSDIYASVGVLLGFLLIRAGFPLADPIVAIIIAGLIVRTGIEIMRDSSRVLLDKAFIDEDLIKRMAESVEGVCACHQVRTRGPPGQTYVDLHIGVDSSLSIDQAHQIGEAVEDKIKESFPGVQDVAVHIEPKGSCELHRPDK